jgi:transcriptional regulator with XRE-family HTH domain
MDCRGKFVKGGIVAQRNGADNGAIRIGARIESLRLEQGLSLRCMAQLTGCSIAKLSHMEKGLASIHVHTLNKIADALQVRPFDLLNYVPEEDDLGYVVETMRKDSGGFAKVKARLRALGGRKRGTTGGLPRFGEVIRTHHKSE